MGSQSANQAPLKPSHPRRRLFPSHEAQRRAGVSPAQLTRSRERRRSVASVERCRRDARPTLVATWFKGAPPKKFGTLHTKALIMLCTALTTAFDLPAAEKQTPNFRKPSSTGDLRYWLQNMVWYHQFTTNEIIAATGLGPDEINAALKKFDIRVTTRPRRAPNAPLLMLPYPGGRHPRMGFLDGAVKPQRETKVSVFTPWDQTSYVVVDVPEAIWSNLGLIYLAHTHVPTVWSKQGIELPTLEWKRHSDGSLDSERTLPNVVAFGATVRSTTNAVRLELWLTNGTKETLSDLRVQNCVMLKGANGFSQQTNDNKVFSRPYVACRSEDGKRWIITARLGTVPSRLGKRAGALPAFRPEIPRLSSRPDPACARLAFVLRRHGHRR